MRPAPDSRRRDKKMKTKREKLLLIASAVMLLAVVLAIAAVGIFSSAGINLLGVVLILAVGACCLVAFSMMRRYERDLCDEIEKMKEHYDLDRD